MNRRALLGAVGLAFAAPLMPYAASAAPHPFDFDKWFEEHWRKTVLDSLGKPFYTTPYDPRGGVHPGMRFLRALGVFAEENGIFVHHSFGLRYPDNRLDNVYWHTTNGQQWRVDAITRTVSTTLFDV